MPYQRPAFPTAQGAGAYSVGGRGGTIYKVTNLNDSGAGSFREACTASGPRIVVFDVAGYIDVQDPINIDDPYISIFGQTAPGHGICLRSAGAAYNSHLLRIRTHNVIIRYIRSCPGPDRGLSSQGIHILHTAGQTDPDRRPHDIIIDHCSFRWSNDVNLGVWNADWDRWGDNSGRQPIERITIQWCFLFDPWDDIRKSNSARNLNLGGGGVTDCSIHHNLLANARGRNPQVRGGRHEIVNNLMFNTIVSSQLGAESAKIGVVPIQINYIGNYEIWGNNSSANYMVFLGEGGEACDDPDITPDYELYVSGNAGQYKAWPFGDEWDIVGCDFGAGSPADARWQVLTPHTIVGGIPVTTESIFSAYDRILAHGGCKMPTCFGRDKADRRIVNQVQLHGGFIPGSTMAEVHGWPTLSPGYPQPADPDGDAVWSWFETANGSNPAVADSDQYDYAAAGYTQTYTNVEVFENVHDTGDPHVVTHIDVN